MYRLLGISFNVKKYKHTQCIMYYTSMISNKFILGCARRGIIRERKYNCNLQLALGTIMNGILGNEPILLPDLLNNDIKFAINNNLQTVTIFRLGGLNTEYINKINNNLA